MKTTLSADGKIGIPDEIRQTDQLAAGALATFNQPLARAFAGEKGLVALVP